MTKTQQLNVCITTLSAQQVLLKLACTWPTGQEEKCSKEWRGDQEETDTKQENKNRKCIKRQEAEAKMHIYSQHMQYFISHLNLI
jgi:hypothetical protein